MTSRCAPTIKVASLRASPSIFDSILFVSSKSSGRINADRGVERERCQNRSGTRRCRVTARVTPSSSAPSLTDDTDNFSFSVFPCILFYSTGLGRPAHPRKSLFRPLALIKPKACYARVSSLVGRGLRDHSDRANCLNPRALFAKLCTVPRKLLLTLARPRPPPGLPKTPRASFPSCPLFFRDSQSVPLSRGAVEHAAI